ncbi:MAG: hypothetical protein JWP35_3902 [Caulobacter sp.]|nr:hypothetical protein [Caulobacter sp.]
MKSVLRLVIGVLGLLALLVAARFWMDPGKIGGVLGVQPMGLLGLATLRADMAGFFGTAGLLALAAAIRDDRRLLTAPLIMIGLALTGRIITAGLSGLAQPTIMPMVVEAVGVVLIALGRRSFGVAAR